jgi:hypothetical protein
MSKLYCINGTLIMVVIDILVVVIVGKTIIIRLISIITEQKDVIIASIAANYDTRNNKNNNIGR